MKPKELSAEDMSKLQIVVNNKSLVISDVILKSMEIISELTHYTTVVLGNQSNDNLIQKVEVVPIDKNNMVAIIVTDKGNVVHKNIYIPGNIDSMEIKQTVDLINKIIIGTSIDKVSEVLEYQVKPIIGNYVKQHEVLYNAFYNAFSDFTNESVRVNGTKNILMQPEFNDAESERASESLSFALLFENITIAPAIRSAQITMVKQIIIRFLLSDFEFELILELLEFELSFTLADGSIPVFT
jgi:heat-inducible transcriptional repressor